jgi:2-polyprenyl-3-methyl-5-hydroxy-6-metoxy-1,4-benzoquinol methylase
MLALRYVWLVADASLRSVTVFAGIEYTRRYGGGTVERQLHNEPSDYVLGHGADELDRLLVQGRFFGDLTEHVLRLAGIAPGMKVLDAGCGIGDVTFLAARLVGPEGAVVGVDLSPVAIETAQRRAATAGLAQVEFLTGDLSDLTLDEPVDALVGRLVLQYLPDPAPVVRQLLTSVKVGGVVAFQEGFLEDKPYSAPACQLYEQVLQWITETFTRIGTDPYLGRRLPTIFQEAGLPAPQAILHARVESGQDATIYPFVAQFVRALLPVMERTGVATAEEVGLETLSARLRDEAVALGATLMSPCLIGAWARRQSSAS